MVSISFKNVSKYEQWCCVTFGVYFRCASVFETTEEELRPPHMVRIDVGLAGSLRDVEAQGLQHRD